MIKLKMLMIHAKQLSIRTTLNRLFIVVYMIELYDELYKTTHVATSVLLTPAPVMLASIGSYIRQEDF